MNSKLIYSYKSNLTKKSADIKHVNHFVIISKLNLLNRREKLWKTSPV